ncbi:hypothetical protein V502_02793 [Pseudogymnoascus sp. VKM F-4520 (FW-2644)]|nr:hypothetical protein V502_02793 [Pseudogymnoascus sp. VKM F-4520 (FW-2644)]
MAEYTDAQRWLVRHWRADDVSLRDIPQRYNELYDDNPSLCGLCKVAKRSRTTPYSMDSPPLKRQKPISLVKEVSEQKDKAPEPIPEKEQELHPSGHGIIRLNSKNDTMAFLFKKAEEEENRKIKETDEAKEPTSRADEIKAGLVKPDADLTVSLSAPSECDGNNKAVPSDADHSCANTDLDKEEHSDAIPTAEPDAETIRTKRLVFRNITLPPNYIHVDVKTESGQRQWSGRASEFTGFLRATTIGKSNVMQENANTTIGPRIEITPTHRIASQQYALQSECPLLPASDKRLDQLARLMVQNGADVNAVDNESRQRG